jgi:nucleoside-diphosphate-sugar epimerase
MPSIFITGAAGFIGSEFVRQSVAANNHVYGLTRSEESARLLQTLGATPVIGDLAQPDGWRQVISDCETVVHLAQPDTYGARITIERARNYAAKRLQMDKALLDAVNRDRIKRVVFVYGTSYYGQQGTELRSEETEPNPRGWGPYIAPAIEALTGFVAQGLPIVQAYPGWVYGPGSWIAEYQLQPLSKGMPVMRLAGRPQIVSPIHVKDCARGLLHLLGYGEIGQRYFIVDDMAVPSTQMVHTAAQAMGVPGRILPLPKFFCQMALGQIVTESMECDFCLSNKKIKSLGFSLHYPDINTGIPDVVHRWQASQNLLTIVNE